MAYNREWDNGKDQWTDGPWNNPAAGMNHPRDEDYYGDGKRRKFNNGVSFVSLPLPSRSRLHLSGL